MESVYFKFAINIGVVNGSRYLCRCICTRALQVYIGLLYSSSITSVWTIKLYLIGYKFLPLFPIHYDTYNYQEIAGFMLWYLN